MLGLRRVAILRLRHVRNMALAASQPTSRQTRAPLFRDNNRGIKKNMPVLPAEQIRLQNKHRDALESNRAETLQEIVDHIEWRGMVYSETPEKVAKLLADPKEDLTLLSDRQLSVLLSTFGDGCESVGSLRKAAFMSQALKAIRDRGVALGPLARNAILSARIDNGEQVSVVEELKDWDAAGLSPDAETYGYVSKVYANAANTQAIVDIINHMKTNGMAVTETVLESLIYSLAKLGHYKQAEAFVQKFAATANEVLLHTAIARAAVSRGDISIAVSTVAAIPVGAKPNQISNNKLILGVLIDMLEAGEVDAIEKMSPYLTMAPEGATLVEWHMNSKVLARCRRACSEGKLDMALKLYGLLHPKFRNSNFELSFADALGNRLRDTSHDIDSIFALAESMEKCGIVRDHVLFLLEKSISTPRAYEVLSIVQKRGLLEKCLSEKPALRKSLAQKLSEKLTNVKLAKEERIRLLADLATVLFSYDSERTVQDVMSMYPVIYVLGGKDVDLAIPALESLKSAHVRKEYATALVQQLLRKGDPLAEEKLEKLLDSGAVQSLSVSRVQKQIAGFVVNREKKEGAADERQLALAARLLALNFPPENSKVKSPVAAKYVIAQLQSELLTVSRARMLVSYLEKEQRVRFSPEDIADGKKLLIEKGQKEKAELLERLRKKSQTYARWLESDLEALEEEMAHIQASADHKPAVVNAIHEVILKKISSEKPINYKHVDRHLHMIKESANKPSSRMSDLASQMFSTAFSAAMSEKNFDVMKELWKNRIGSPSVENTLTYISLLALSGRKEEADVVSEDLRASALTITPSALQTVGERLGDEWSIDEMRHLSQYLQKKFNLGTQQLLRIIICVRQRQLERLIEAGKLEEALQLMVEHTVESNSALGQYQLAAAAIRAENMGVLKSVFDVVKRAHGKEVAFLDLAMVLLEEGRTDRALKILETPQLKISQGKLDYFIRRATENNRPDVLRGLFTGLCQQDRASTVALNRLLVQLSRMYYKSNDFAQLESLEAEIERISFPLEQQMRTVFENLQRKKLEVNGGRKS
nr:hypothetical protein, variant [Haemonchus contortus]